ncbi:MAG TPA: adenylate/guanylate cyclase domain-containing protein [Methylomirabilota bacterium]|nr:adenylate/guanylate cyclase domain-containing protein [Methylomirabilota bacterium]
MVTVLFADLAGFTGIAEKLDPEEVHQIVDRCFEKITAEVHRFEGTINQYTGDGVMALFGAPIAHEDSARRAVHAALGIQRALREYGRELQTERGLTVQMRIGLNTGSVVVGRIGDDLRMDYTAVGDTTNLASRLQHMARPGGVLVSATTWKAVGDFFEGLDFGEVEVKGHAPARAYEVLRPRGRRSRLDVAAERGLTPLVGRARELATLLELFAEVKAGRGQVAFIAGDAGIGKSRLTLEFRRALAEAGENVTWLEGQCVSFGQSIPFLPVVDQLRRNFAIEELDGEPEIIAKVEHGMRRMGGLEAHIPYVRYLLSVDAGDPAIVAMDPLARRKKVLEAVRAMSVRGAQLRPIVFVFEDLHWVDSSSEEYLGSLMDSVASAPMMLVMTYRVGYTPPFGSRSFATALTLRALSEAETLSLAGRVLGTEHFPPELRAALMDKAEGVPLFIEEVTKTLLDLGVIRRANGGYHMVKSIADVAVPDTIQDIIMARLDRLGEDGKRTVQLAAVIGRQFVKRLLERMADFSDRLEGLLAELKTLEIIYEQGLLPEPSYIFKHAVIQDVAYQSLLLQRRKALHRGVAAAIEELYGDRLAEHYEELAHHFLQGEDWVKAFEYHLRSGDKARDAYANQTAIDLYGRALEAGQRAGGVVPPARLMAVHQRRSRLWIVLSRYPEAIAEAEKVVELARAAGDRRGEGEALADVGYAHLATLSGEHIGHLKRHAEEARLIAEETGDEHLLARCLYLLGFVETTAGTLDAGMQRFEESIRIAESKGLADTVAPSLTMLGAIVNWRGDFRRALEISERAETVAREVHDHFNEFLAVAFRCVAHIALGQYAQGLAVIEDGLAKARERNIAFNIGRLTNTLGWLYQELGDFRRAAEYDEEGVDLGQRYRVPNVEISSIINLGIDHVARGEPRKALAMMETIAGRIDNAFGAHRWRWKMRVAVPLAEAHAALGESARALEHVERGLAQAQAADSRKYIAKMLAIRGDIALGQGDARRAASDAAEALRIVRAIGYPTLTWQSAHLLGRALAAQGRMEEAFDATRLAVETIDATAAHAPDAALRQSFLAWPRVQAAQEDFERFRRA